MPPNPSPPMSVSGSSNQGSANAFLAHMLAQTRSNIDFLVSQGYITQREASGIGSRLRALQEEAETEVEVGETAHSMNERLGLEQPRAPSPPKAVLPVTRRAVPPRPPSTVSPAPALPQARALWDYNADGSDMNDLSFRAGDIIAIIAETNADWWTGRLANNPNSREGLFPANYVEKIATPTHLNANVPPVPIPEPTPRPMSSNSFNRNSNFPPSRFVAPPAPPSYNSHHAPAPWGGRPQWPPQPSGPSYGGGNEKQEYAVAPPQPQAGPVTQAPPPPQPEEQPEKKSKFGGLGQTMATSAAGGVGFGAGAAIGSGLINAIF